MASQAKGWFGGFITKSTTTNLGDPPGARRFYRGGAAIAGAVASYDAGLTLPVAHCSSEKVIIPDRGAEMGNFGTCVINESESWITVSEGMFMKNSSKRGAKGAILVAHILWSKPNTGARR